jgi:hypothetical protein
LEIRKLRATGKFVSTEALDFTVPFVLTAGLKWPSHIDVDGRESAMASPLKNFLAPPLVILWFAGLAPHTQGAENSQYRAVMTKIFLSNYP